MQPYLRFTSCFSLPIAFAVVSIGAVACSSTDVDNTILEPSRDARISSLASAACEHYGDVGAGCPGYGTGDGQRYATEGDCERDFESKASDLWPDADCNRGQISAAAYERCEQRAEVYACSTGASSVFDAIAALDECKASSVCTDPVQ